MMVSENKTHVILLVDDEVLVRSTLRSILLRFNSSQIIEAEDGVFARDILEQKDVDIVITDLHMPRMGGLELLRTIRESHPLIPVAVVTGFPTLDVAVEAMKTGASDFIVKPFKIKQIELVVQKLIKDRDLLLENAQLNRELEHKEEIERLNRLLKKKVKDLTVLYKVGEALNESALNRETLFNQIVELCLEVTEAKRASLMLMNPENKKLEIKAFRGYPLDSDKKRSLRLGEGIAAKVAKEGRPLLIKDIRQWQAFLEMPPVSADTRSFLSVPLLIKGEVLGVLNAVDKTNGKGFSNDDMKLLSAVVQRAALCLENLALYESVYNNLADTLRSLVSTIEARDPNTKHHSHRVTQWSVEMARILSVDTEDIEIIQFAGYLHDIGKIGIPDSILMKPGTLNAEEYEIIKTHPAIGENIVKHLNLLPKEKTLIRHHHERWDGKGYPDRLAGEEIQFLARILAVADSFDAMTSDRVYRKARVMEDALCELKQCAGSQFDPFIVDAFLSLQALDNRDQLFKKQILSS